AALLVRAPRVLAIAPAGDARAIARLGTMLGVAAARLDDGETATALARLQCRLFEDGTRDLGALDETVSIASWPGEARECVEIARRIQAAAAADAEPTPDPDAPVIEGALRAPWRWEHLLVEAAVIGGRDRWRRRLDGLANELELRKGELREDDARALGLARAAADLAHLS